MYYRHSSIHFVRINPVNRHVIGRHRAFACSWNLNR